MTTTAPTVEEVKRSARLMADVHTGTDLEVQCWEVAGLLRRLLAALDVATRERDEARTGRLASVKASPDDLRADGWAVAVHNDYRLDGRPHTFWLLTRGDRCLKGEGRDDQSALNEIRAQVSKVLSGEEALALARAEGAASEVEALLAEFDSAGDRPAAEVAAEIREGVRRLRLIAERTGGLR